ncbi:MAG: synthase subunit b [Rickettsiaceae bacterium]|jgi:F-type H+-transporting ATPase subunit b|nr:synthase subunit b [Rickettsiaceae bacterium]
MPQFDPSSFISQLFWLAICFGLLYFSMSKIFLPRIREILRERHSNIDKNQSLALQICSQTNEIEEANKKLKESSISQYKDAIDQSVKQASLHKEEGLSNLRLQISKMMEQSKIEIAEFKNSSQSERKKVMEKLAEDISHLFLGNKVN